MSKRASLDSQFFNVMEQSTELGRSKHSDKGTENNQDHTIIYSRADRQNLSDASKDLVGYIKQNYSEVKYVRDIKPEMVQNFLDTKMGNSQATIDKTWSLVGKIERMTEQVYSIKLDWKENMEKPESEVAGKIRDISFDPKDWNAIKELIDSKSSISKSSEGLLVARDFGLRAESVTNIRTKDITFGEGGASLHIYKDKGNRDRTLTTKDPEVIGRLEDLVKNKGSEERLIPIEPDSINRQLARLETELGIREKYQEAKTGVHSIRKMWAKEQFVSHMDSGMTKQAAMDNVSVELGHGKGRNELMETYIGQETLEQY